MTNPLLHPDLSDEEVAALLDFTPVPRRPRVDGWTPDVQRAFILALAVTGSARRAAAAVGKAQFGADQLRKAEGSESFLAAWDRALALFEEKKARRIELGVEVAKREDAAWRPALGPWAQAASRRHLHAAEAPEEPEADSDAEKVRWLSSIANKYLIKIDQERKARLDGRIVEADFILRQVTWLEVALDMASGDGLKFLRDFREGGHGLIDMAETPMSKLLGEMRRKKWAEYGEPYRPEHPMSEFLVRLGRFSTEPVECTVGGTDLSHDEQQRAFEERHRQAAADQLRWEEAARQDHDRRRESAAGSWSRDAAPARPACRAEGEDTSDVTGFTPVTASTTSE